ncbi:MAG: hypothetical protein ACFE95_16840 [Candidatus Hodarchaeota archaeon]
MNTKNKSSLFIVFFVSALFMTIGYAYALPMNQDDQAAELPYKNIVTTRFNHLVHGNCTASTGDWIFWQMSWGLEDYVILQEIYNNLIVKLTVDAELVTVDFSDIYIHPHNPNEWVFDVNYISSSLPIGEHQFDLHLELDVPSYPNFVYDSSVWVFVEPFLTSMNARFVKWQEKPHVIHIFAFDDDGREGRPPALVALGQPVLVGFEWGTGFSSVNEIQERIIGNPDHFVTLSVDGGEPFSIKKWYQNPFYAETGSGPAWRWDHDGDGPGDNDGDGISDWDGPVTFFRYHIEGLSAGEHTLVFTINNPLDNHAVIIDIITVIVG